MLGLQIVSTVTSFFTPIDKYIISPLKDHIRYAFAYTSEVAELRHKVQILDGARDNLQNSVDDARRRGDEIQINVEDWLANVDKAIEEAEKLIQREEEANKKRCFAGLCPNLMVRYQLGKKAAEDALAIASLENEGKFDRDQISFRAPLQQIVTTTVNCFEGLPSRESIFKEVMDAIKDPNINMIGLYGMGGTGKSTLASEVHRQAVEAKLFDVVAMATVSEKPKIKEIQGKIADVMGLKLEEETVDGRASRLHQELKKKEKILVILDNLWAAIELKAIGIPSAVEHKGCKLLLTSRNLDILTSGMGTHKFFKLEPLSEDEARKLFQIIVGNGNTQIMPSLANEVASKCVGIPLALVPVAKALRNKELHAWKCALNQLCMTSRFDNKGMQAELYAALELSFNHLDGEEVKSLFLLLPLYVYTSINIKYMLKYGVGLGLFEGIVSIEDARNRLLKLIDDLKASCFLQDGDEDGFVDVHDFVQAFAMSVAITAQNAAVVKTDFELKEFAERHVPNSCTRLTLVCSDINDLPEDLKCPELDFLLVYGTHSLKIPDSFFSSTRKVKVLDCSEITFSVLPQSLCLLTSLHTLCLYECVLPNIAMVGTLKKLEILSLLGSDIVELPREIGQLTQLKMLDLTNCTKLEVISANVLSQLSLLEELYISNSFDQWEVKRLDNQTNASLSELEHLSRLTNLEIDVPDAAKLPNGLFFERLERFKISIGEGWDWGGKYQTSRTLKLKLHKNIHSWGHGVKILLKKAEDLYLDEVKGVTNVLYDLHKEGFLQLKHLLVQEGGDIRFIIDSEGRLPFDAFSVLESLILHNLENLEKICRGQLMAGDFCQLRILRVKCCNRLKNLFPFYMITNLKQLRKMEVMNCNNIEEIFADETEEGDDKNEVFEFSELCSLKLQLPLLRRFCSKVKLSPASTSSTHSRQNQLTVDSRWPLLNEMIAFPNLKNLKLSSIMAESIWWKQSGDHSSFYNLKTLIVEACRNINYLFDSAIVRNLGQLQRLEICECKSMEGVIATEGETISKASPFPKLEFLKFKGLLKLVRFCNGDLMELPCLKKLWIENCPALNSFISNSMASTTSGNNLALFDEKVAFPNLEELRIEDMNGLKIIWHNELHEGSFCKLKTMVVQQAKELVNVFPSNMLMSRFLNLEHLDLMDCKLLEEVFDLPPHEELINFSRSHEMPVIQLRNLILRNLPNLKHIWKKDAQEREIIFFHKLHDVDVSQCPSLKSIFPASIATCLLELKELSIEKCGVELIVDRGRDRETVPRFEFPHLTTLKLSNLEKLKMLYVGAHTSDWPMLEKLDIHDCPEVEIFSLENRSIGEKGWRNRSENLSRQPFFIVEKIAFPNLKELKLSSITVKSIWWKQSGGHSSFYNLNTLIVEACRSINYLFNSAIVRNLGQLQRLEICECKSMEGVIAIEGETISKASPFPKLEFLKLKGLLKLVRFCTGDLMELPCLKQLWIENCPALNSFISNPITTISKASLPLFDEKVAFPNLEELRIEDMNGLNIIWENELHEGSFCKLKTMVVRQADKLVNVFPANMLMSRFLNLECLDLVDCELLVEVFDLPPHEELINVSTSHGMPTIQLRNLMLRNLPNLKRIWNLETPTRENIFFHKLHVVKVSRCQSLKSIFPAYIATCLLELKELCLGFCGIEEIIDRGEDRETIPRFEFPQLTTLELHDLGKLKMLYPEKHTFDWPMLEKLEVHDCPEVEIFSLESQSIGGKSWRSQSNNLSRQTFFVVEKIVFSYLKELKLSSIKVEEIWNSQHIDQLSCFQHLTTLIVEDCENLRYLFTSSVVKYLNQIERLDICNCKSMEEVVLRQDVSDGESSSELLFPKVEVLKLEGLPKLTAFCTCSLFECPVLKELQIDNCPQLKSLVADPASVDGAPRSQIDKCDPPLFDDKVAFPAMEELIVRNMYWLKTLWHNELHEDSFCKLKILRVEQTEALSKVFPSYMLVTRFQNLEKLFIEDCESLEEVFDTQGLMIREIHAEASVSSQTRLKTLKIRNLPNLKHVWNKDPRELLSFQNLYHVGIQECPNLRSVFPSSIARGLRQLEILVIDGCGIEEIVDKEKAEETTTPPFIFPKLTHLLLLRLPKLKRFYSGRHTLEWPALKVLSIYHCDKMHTLEFQRFQQEDEGLDGIQVEPSLFSFQEVIPHLEALTLTCKEATMIWERQFPDKLFHNLQYLRLQCFHDKSTVLPSGLLERFPNIGLLYLRCNQRRELFPFGLIGEGNHAKPIPRIKRLEIHDFPNARHARDQDSQIVQLLQNLDTLKLFSCNGLTNLAPLSASFQSITSLDIFECRALVHLFTLSTVVTLVQLRKMRIRNCDMVTEIVASTGHDINLEIVFLNLESLKLHCLPRLTSFCSGEHSFEFPSLTKAIVSQCPKMELFSKGVLRTPKLQRVKLTQQKDKERWNDNLNTTIQHLYKKMVGFHGLQELRLIDFPNLKEAWHNELPAECFYDLRSLVVENCASFSNAVPSSLLSFLNRLKKLDVRNCDSLEEVFFLEGQDANLEHPVLFKLNEFLLSDLPRLRYIWNKAFCGILDFRNLKLLKVQNCSSLKYIFTPTMALSLMQIQQLEVKNCTFVEEIITSGEEEAVVDTIFSQLNSIVLESLPNLIRFCSSTNVLELQSLEKLTVVDCPRIETFASTILRAQEPNIVDKDEERLGQEGFSTLTVLLFGAKVTCQGLKELKVEWNNSVKDMLRGKFSTECFAKIKVLELTNFPHEENLFPFDILLKLTDLEKLVVNDAHFRELFLQHKRIDKDNNDEEVTKLRQLKLSKLPYLSQLFQHHSIPDLVIQNLEILEVIECVGLKILMSSLLSFQNLTTLEVSKCHGLTKLMTSSTTKSLEKLTRMSITECDMLEEVVASEGNEGEDEIAFSQLKHLGLHCLPNLVNFCSGNHTFNFPSLEEVVLRECSKMKFFSKGVLFTPLLTEVQTALDEDQWRWEECLNTTVQKLFLEMGVENA